MTSETDLTTAAERLAARVAELEHERKHLLAVIEILQEISGQRHYVDILQAIARRLGETFGLDRASIFLAERAAGRVRLVASYEDPSIRNLVVDLERYPELQRAMQSGQTVFIGDAQKDPALQHIRGRLVTRRVQSITVVPLQWRRVVIGAIFLRTFRDGPPFSDSDVRFVSVIASVTAKALHNAHRYERLVRRSDIERAALVEFLTRLLETYTDGADAFDDGVLPEASAAELDRLVGVAMTVIQEESRGR
jgi:GAF domain-containing protein